MTEDLRVDTGLVRESGGKLQTIAGLIPEPPATFSPPGGDALSTAIAGKVAEVVDPVVAQMPITKDALTRYAQNVLNAADKYDTTDRQIAEEILKRLGLFDDAAGAGGSGSAGGGAGTARRGSAGSPARRRVPGGGRGAAGRPDGPDDADADADGPTGRSDPDAAGGHGGGDSAGDDARRSERRAAGRSIVGDDRRGRGEA